MPALRWPWEAGYGSAGAAADLFAAPVASGGPGGRIPRDFPDPLDFLLNPSFSDPIPEPRTASVGCAASSGMLCYVLS